MGLFKLFNRSFSFISSNSIFIRLNMMESLQICIIACVTWIMSLSNHGCLRVVCRKVTTFFRTVVVDSSQTMSYQRRQQGVDMFREIMQHDGTARHDTLFQPCGKIWRSEVTNKSSFSAPDPTQLNWTQPVELNLIRHSDHSYDSTQLNSTDSNWCSEFCKFWTFWPTQQAQTIPGYAGCTPDSNASFSV